MTVTLKPITPLRCPNPFQNCGMVQFSSLESENCLRKKQPNGNKLLNQQLQQHTHTQQTPHLDSVNVDLSWRCRIKQPCWLDKSGQLSVWSQALLRSEPDQISMI